MDTRRHLAAELRRLRGDRRAAPIARALGWSESKLSRIETARTGIAVADLERLLTVYGVGDDDRDRLRQLAGRGRGRAWWSPYRAAVSDPYDEYVALEAEAAVMDEWEPQVVPGLLQTDEYARAVVEAGLESRDPDVVERRVALRMARQAVLTRRPRPVLRVVVDEGALRREVGGPAVMRRQLHRLAEVAGRDGVTVQVLPFSAGVHGGLAGAFTVFAFADGREPVVHTENLTGGALRSRPAEVRVHRDVFADLRRRALGEDDSRALLAELGGALSPVGGPPITRRAAAR
ncbi:helix-turn-helix domain-containing protein [Spirilliplanes yamanashiensis]|uniref:helix-turn-helix domain-containing protein n=1 Tax=Spirilliplanes yamanashiensis TaxID=42233 RepID=UPI001EF16F56|nr:helix-turn-helix transcriptional regulator [Spirilliplanes yamanashiensis]MDP9816132.1 transcriptional regulator with XRE-family HTH domain [Spirilliplanes yamanashiensis]